MAFRLGFSKDGLNVYQFAQQFAIGEELDSKYYGPLFTPRMLDLEQAFRGEAVNAKTGDIRPQQEYPSDFL